MKLKFTKMAAAVCIVLLNANVASGSSGQLVGSYDFSYMTTGSMRASPVQVFDDGRNTYFQFRAGEAIPAIFAQQNGTMQLLVPLHEGPYVKVEQVHGQFTLQLGRAQAMVVHAGGNRLDAPQIKAVAPNGMTAAYHGGEVRQGTRVVASLAPAAPALVDDALERNSYATPTRGDRVGWVAPEKRVQEHVVWFPKGSHTLGPMGRKLVQGLARSTPVSGQFVVMGRDDESLKEGLEQARADAMRDALVPTPMGIGMPAATSTAQTTPLVFSGKVSGMLDLIASRFGVSWEWDGKGIYFFKTKSQTFRLAALPGDTSLASRVGTQSNNATGGSQGSQSSGSSSSELRAGVEFAGLSIWKGIEDSIRTMMSADGKLVVTASTGTITVDDTPLVLERVSKFVEEQNKALSRQVVINVRVLAVDLSKSHEYGINWEMVYENIGRSIGVSLENLAEPVIGGTNLALRVLPGASMFGGSSAVIQALSKQGRVSQVTSASLVTINNQPAPIQVGRQPAPRAPALAQLSAVQSGANHPTRKSVGSSGACWVASLASALPMAWPLFRHRRSCCRSPGVWVLGRGGLEVKNSRAVDLAVVVGRAVELFEVKTSVDTQSLYTSVGQLIIHSAALSRDGNFEVRRNLVLPKIPPRPFDEIIREEVVTRLITYRKVKGEFVFEGLSVG